MNRLKWIASLSAIALLASCGHRSQVSQPPTQAPKPQAPLIQAATPAPAALLPVPLAPITKTVPVQGLVTATNAQAHASQIVTTPKRDPFAPILSLPENLKAVVTKSVSPTAAKSVRLAPAKAPNRLVASRAVLMPRMPTPRVAAPPLNLPPITPLADLPALAIPSARPVAPVSWAEAIEVTGVVQTTGKLVAIIKTPGESGRYAQAGDYLAGGQVLLKQIVIGKSGEPRVILQQNGVEVIKAIGAPGPIARGL